jgi:carbon monoxide dehydrogenase subunit G
MKLDFSSINRAELSEGKKTERVTFTADDDLAGLLKQLSCKMNTSVSELCQDYVIECATRDLGQILLRSARADKKLRDLIK